MKTNLILTVIFIFSFWGCDKNKTPENQSSKIVCVLFDLSETTNTPEIRKTYLDKFRIVLNRMHPGDVIEAALITEKSLSELELAIECEFPVIKTKTNTELFEKKFKEQSDSILNIKIDSLLIVADSVLFKPKRKILRTEILSSLQVAERVFKSFKQPRKVLVIFSDMIEESSIANFARRDVSGSLADEIIKKQKENGTLPDLKGVKVYVVGAAHSDTKKYNQIRNFWLNYFEHNGAVMEKQNYGAALIRFDE
ncbi:MAG: hypothetical protein KKF20_05495 [Bacteroidetes bacterium]|nr:hypothetical protein [Bacteroidota bacterium]